MTKPCDCSNEIRCVLPSSACLKMSWSPVPTATRSDGATLVDLAGRCPAKQQPNTLIDSFADGIDEGVPIERDFTAPDDHDACR